MSALAFFPWLSIRSDRELGPVRLIRYRRGELPGDQRFADQASIDEVLSAYANRGGLPVKNATLIEVDDWHLGMDVREYVDRLHWVRSALGFAALDRRRLFQGHFGYVCFDDFQLHVQGLARDHGGHLLLQSRRRDGGTATAWATRTPAFSMPAHVHGRRELDLDESLFANVVEETRPRFREAVHEFCLANTDSADVPPYIEMVMAKSSFEALLGVGPRASDLCDALERVLGVASTLSASERASSEWTRKWKITGSLVDAWVRDFCSLRGASAHGGLTSTQVSVWDERSHLAFASVVFPLLFRKLASANRIGLWGQSEDARWALIERYLVNKPFGDTAHQENIDAQHPWVAIEEEISLACLRDVIATHMQGR